MKLSVAPVRYRLKLPIATARGTMDERFGWRVSMEVDGVSGRGEALPMASFGTEQPAQCLAALERYQVHGPPESLADIETATLPLSETPVARFAVECALLEHLARRRGVPVARLLSPAPRKVLPANALIEGADAAALGRAAAQARDEGFGTVKVKVAARPLSVDAQRLLAVRRAVGPGVGIRVDANGGWTEGTARSALRGLQSLGLELCEQPLPPADVEGLRRLRWGVPCPIAADESVLLVAATERMLEADPHPAVQVLVLKPAALGGLIPALKLAQHAHTLGIGAYVTTLMDGPLSRAAAGHLAAAIPQEGWAHGLSTVELLDGLAEDPLAAHHGLVRLSDVPGWGVPW